MYSEGEMTGKQSLITRSGVLSFPGDLLRAMDLTIFSTWLIFTLASKKNFQTRGTPGGETSQGADFPNCLLTDVNKEIIEFISHDVLCPLRRISGKETFLRCNCELLFTWYWCCFCYI